MPKLSRGQVAGFAALGLLVVLAAVTFLSSRQGRTTVPTSSPGTPAAPEASAPRTAPDTEAAPATGHPKERKLERDSKGTVITAVAEDVMLTPKARLLAERLNCVCGCNDVLATCTCSENPGSHDMKKYLQQLVDEGKNPSEVEEAMVARYGAAVRR